MVLRTTLPAEREPRARGRTTTWEARLLAEDMLTSILDVDIEVRAGEYEELVSESAFARRRPLYAVIPTADTPK